MIFSLFYRDILCDDGEYIPIFIDVDSFQFFKVVDEIKKFHNVVSETGGVHSGKIITYYGYYECDIYYSIGYTLGWFLNGGFYVYW